jgi:hypothetical protein
MSSVNNFCKLVILTSKEHICSSSEKMRENKLRGGCVILDCWNELALSGWLLDNGQNSEYTTVHPYFLIRA